MGFPFPVPTWFPILPRSSSWTLRPSTPSLQPACAALRCKEEQFPALISIISICCSSSPRLLPRFVSLPPRRLPGSIHRRLPAEQRRPQGASENRLFTLHVSSSHSAVPPPASSSFRSLAEIDSRQISWPFAITSVELVNYNEHSLGLSI